MTEELFYAANPVFNLDGEDIDELARDVLYLCVSDTVDGLKTLEARFLATGPVPGRDTESILYLDGRYLDFGKRIKVTLGANSRQRFVFEGVISGLEVQFDGSHSPEVCIYAEDTLMDLRMTRRSRTYEDMDDGQIAELLASEHGLSAQVNVNGPRFDQVQQFNMSDLAFLRERARLLQAEVWLDDGTVHFATRDNREASRLLLIRGRELLSVRVGADLAHQRSAVHVCGFDANQVERIDEVATENAILGEIERGRTGISVLVDGFGEKVSRRVMEVPLQSEEARDWAEAELRRRARRFVTVNAVAVGQPDMMVGSVIELEQLGAPFNGDGYYVTKVQQVFTASEGHRTHFEAERATIN